MEITAQLVKQLRDATGAGMMDCKKALEETNGDVEAATRILREKGIASAAKRADRAATQGLIVAASRNNNTVGALINLRCETDFVARNEEFAELAKLIGDHVADHLSDDVPLETVLDSSFGAHGEKVGDAVKALSGKIGEKIELARAVRVTVQGAGVVDTYVHHDKTKGAIVALSVDSADAAGKPELTNLAHEIALQVVITGPIYLSREEISQDRIQQELEVERARAINEGKPEAAADKIAQGRVEKAFIQASSLLDQPYWRDEKKTVAELVKETAGALGTNVKVTKFVRLTTSDEVA